MPRKPRPFKRTKRSIAAKKRLNTTCKNTTAQEETSDEVFERLLNESRTENSINTVNTADTLSLSSSSKESSDESEPELQPLIVEKSNEPEEITVKGRRIVDIHHVMKQLEHVAAHPYKCTMGKFKLLNETRSGLYSVLHYYCDNCEKTCNVTSLPLNEKEDVNDALVWGAMAIGVGHSQVEELFSVIDVPLMTPEKFRSHETKVGEVWEEHLIRKMKENAEEEKRIAVEKGNVFHGMPFITVIGDGGWAKRSYGHGMNSLSGVGTIIGAETKKILFLGVRNKFCFACSNPRKKKGDHICYKNYTGPSTGMESSVIVEGFRRSEYDYGLIYKYYIGDGDSSVFARIQEGCQYGRYVQKVECANHVTRALSDNLHKLAENTQFPLTSRQQLSKPAPGEPISRLERIVKGVRTAIKKATTTKSANDVKNLRQAIKNSPDHVFGNHLQCGNFCKRKASKEENILENLDKDFLNKIRSVIGYVESKADSLVFNETTNVAERYMGCVAKFTGGKRVNLSTGGSYQRRCLGAALAHSAGPSWHLSPWRKLSSKSPGAIFKTKVLKREKRNLKRKLFHEQKPSKRKRREGGGYDKEYGPLAMKQDIDDEEMEIKSSQFIENLRKDVEGGNNPLQCNTIGQYANPLWREKRMNRLTASRFGSVAKRKSHTPCHNLVKSILIQRPINTEAVTFGRDHEDEVLQMYQERTSLKVEKCGLFVDEKTPFLGASPDGLVGDNGLVEIKCLHSIKDNLIIDHLETNKNTCLEVVDKKVRLKRTHNYFYQVQGQLNICKRDWCDFVVYTRKGELFIERIRQDDDFWGKVQPKLVQFYLGCMLPEILDSRLVRQMKIRDPPCIIQAQKDLDEKRQKVNNVQSETKLKSTISKN